MADRQDIEEIKSQIRKWMQEHKISDVLAWTKEVAEEVPEE